MPVLFEVPRSWRPSLENGGVISRWGNMATGGSEEMWSDREEMDRFQHVHQMEEQSHVGRGMETLMGKGREGNKNH